MAGAGGQHSVRRDAGRTEVGAGGTAETAVQGFCGTKGTGRLRFHLFHTAYETYKCESSRLEVFFQYPYRMKRGSHGNPVSSRPLH